MERREDAGDQVERTDVIGDERSHRRWRVAVAAGGADEAAGGLSGEIRTTTARIGPHRPERAPRGPDDAGIDGGQFVVAEPPALKRARREVADDDVRAFDKATERIGALLLPEVQRQAALAAIAGDERGAAQIICGEGNVAARVAYAGQFDLDDIGAHVAQQRGRLRPLDQERRFEHPNAGEGGPSQVG